MPSGFNIEANVSLNSASLNASAKEVKQALGRITGQASEFQKSLDASTARVFAFGATTAVLNGVTQSFKKLVSVTIEVEKRLVEINSIFQATDAVFNKFRNSIFQVAKETGQAFNTVAEGAAELARQGLSAEATANRLKAALVLTRISGLDAEKSVKALTAAINGFASAGLTANQIVNKMVAVDTAFAVSAQDLAEAFSRAGSTAEDAGVSFNQLLGLVTAVEQRTARGGAVIGNAFKSIFTRLSRGNTIDQLRELGVEIDATQSGIQKLQALSKALGNISDPTVASQIKELAGGVFQINVVSAALKDLGSDTSIFASAAKTASQATNEAFEKNAALNKTISAQINTLVVGLTSLAEKIGTITFGPLLENLISLANKFTEFLDKALDPEKGNVFIKGLFKSIGQFLGGPALVIFTAAFVKIFGLVAKFAKDGLKSIFLIGSETQKIQGIEAGLIGLLQKDEQLRKIIASTTASQAQKEEAVINAIRRENALLTQQAQIMRSLATMAAQRGVVGMNAQGGFKGRGRKMFPHGFKQEEAMAKALGAKNPRAKMVNARINGRQENVVANSEEVIARGVGRNGDDAIIPTYMAAGGYVPNFARPRLIRPSAGAATFGGKTAAEWQKDGKSRKEVEAMGFKPAAVSSAFGKKKTRASKKPKGVLNIDASNFGVLSAFQGDGTSSPFTKTFSGPTMAMLKTFRDKSGNPLGGKNTPVNKVQLKGLQIRNLENFNDGFKRKFKGGITDFFATPLQQFGSHMIGQVFKNDEAAKISNKLQKSDKTRLFSKSVEGGIFESAMRMVLKGERAIKDFKSDTDDSASWDFEEKGSLDKDFQDFAKWTPRVFRADAKRTSSGEAVRSIIAKIIQNGKSRGYVKTNKRAHYFAGGFIPNAGPMNDAIQRERDAGVPVNKIRAHFAGGSLGGPAVAISNTNDEKLGLKSVPNFAKTPKVSGGGGMGVAGFFKFQLLQQGVNMLVASKQQEIAATETLVSNELEAAEKAKKAAEKFGFATKELDKQIFTLKAQGEALQMQRGGVGKDLLGTGLSTDHMMMAMMAAQMLPDGSIKKGFGKGKAMLGFGKGKAATSAGGGGMLSRFMPAAKQSIVPQGMAGRHMKLQEITARQRMGFGPQSRGMRIHRGPMMPHRPPTPTPKGFAPKGLKGGGIAATLALLTAQAVSDLTKSNEGEKGRDEMFFFNKLGGKEGFNDLFGLSDTKSGMESATGKIRLPFIGGNFNKHKRENMVPNQGQQNVGRSFIDLMTKMTGEIPKLVRGGLQVDAAEPTRIFGQDITTATVPRNPFQKSNQGRDKKGKFTGLKHEFTSRFDKGHLGKGEGDMRLGLEEQRTAHSAAATIAFKEQIDRAFSEASALKPTDERGKAEKSFRLDAANRALKAFDEATKALNPSAKQIHEWNQTMMQGIMIAGDRNSIDNNLNDMIKETKMALQDYVTAQNKAAKALNETAAGTAASAGASAAKNLDDLNILKSLTAPSGPNRERTINRIDLEHQEGLTQHLRTKFLEDQSKAMPATMRSVKSKFGLGNEAEGDKELFDNLKKSGDKFYEQITKASVFFRNKQTEIIEKQKQAQLQLPKLISQKLASQTSLVQDTFTKGGIDFAAIESDSQVLADLIKGLKGGPADEDAIAQIGQIINELTSSEGFKRADDMTEGNLLEQILSKFNITATAFAAAQEAAINQGTGASEIKAGDDGAIVSGLVGKGRRDSLDEPINKNKALQEQLAGQLEDTKNKIREFGDRFGKDDPNAKKIIDNVANLATSLEDAVKFIKNNPLLGKGEGEAEQPNLFEQMSEMNKSVTSMVADAQKAALASAAFVAEFEKKLKGFELTLSELADLDKARGEDRNVGAGR